MRYLKSSIFLILGIIATALYFINMPSINEEDFVTIEAKAGDQTVFDDVSILGRLVNDYTAFYHDNQTTWLASETSYLDQIDLSHDNEIIALQKAYPNFVNSIIFDTSIISQPNFSNTNEYLVGVYFNDSSNRDPFSSSSPVYDQTHFKVLDKNANEENEYILDRENVPGYQYLEIFSIYQTGSDIKVLFTESLDEGDNLKLITFNTDSLAYTEETLASREGDFMPYLKSTSYMNDIATNNSHFIVSNVDINGSSNEMADTLVNLSDHSLKELPASENYYMLSNDDRLYELSVNDTAYSLSEIHTETLETLSTVELAPNASSTLLETESGELPMSIDDLFYQNSPPSLYMVNDKLYVIKNNSEDNSKSIPYEVFNPESGESHSFGEIHFENSNTSSDIATYIESIQNNANAQ